MYRVIFRTCDTVHSVHGAKRPFGLDKRETIELCFRSLVRSLEGFEHSIHVIADNISEELRQFFQAYHVTMTEGTLGNDESIRMSLRLAFGYADTDWVYFCEDDYLHTPEAFLWIDELIAHRETILETKSRRSLKRMMPVDYRRGLQTMPLIIHPPDYPDRYKPRERDPSFLFVSQYCHWRQIANTTFTFMAEVSTLKQFRKILEHSATGADDGYLSKNLFARYRYSGRALCLSPVPGVTTHMHEEVMSPIVDWKKIAAELQASRLP